MAVHGWVRDLSVSGLGAFVAEQLLVGETVTLLLSLPTSGKQEIPARVARQLGTQYGFQFTGLSKEQRAAIRAALGRQPAIPYSDGQNESR
jgi:PilZ domain